MFTFFSKPKTPLRLWFSTDIHCHVIPGVDDGSPDVDTSCELIAGIHELGIQRIIATPHVTQATFENTPQTLEKPLADLRGAMSQRGIDLPLSNSAEYRIDGLLDSNIENGTLMPFPGNYLLIENSFIQEPWNIEQVVFDLQVKGFKPILAHPERYLYYHNKTERYKALKNLDLAFQINLLSLAGFHGKAEKRMAIELAEAGMVDFIGTDMHGIRHLNCFREYLCSREARHHMALVAPLIKNDIFN